MTQDTFEQAQVLKHDIELFEKQRDKIVSINPYKAIIGERGGDIECGIPLGVFDKVQEVITDYLNELIENKQREFESL